MNDDLTDVILEALNKQGLRVEDNDILALASKIITYADGCLKKLKDVKPSGKAVEFAEKFSISPEFAELILCEAEEIYGGVEKAVLTLKNHVLTANAGIDKKNAPVGEAALWPRNPEKWAELIRKRVKERTGRNVGILIVDSRVTPLRIGTTGLALAVAGFKPVKDFRGEKDIFGKKLLITYHAVADDLASAAHLLMGEAAEKTPVVLIKGAPVDFDDEVYSSADMAMPFNNCLFMGSLNVKNFNNV